MELWVFFTIFGLVLFVPTGLLFLLLNRFRNTIVFVMRKNGTLIKDVIDDKILSTGKIIKLNGKKLIKPIKITKEDILYGKWRRWIIYDTEIKDILPNNITAQELEEYVNNEDLLKLYLAGKFKDTLMILLIAIIVIVIIAGITNGFLTSSHQNIITQDNATTNYLINVVKMGLTNITGG